MNDPSTACDNCKTEDEVIATVIGGTVLAVVVLQAEGFLTSVEALEKLKLSCVHTAIETLARFRARTAGAGIVAGLLDGPKAEGL